MKIKTNLRKSKLLLFFLLACFAGGGISPAWADEAITENFNGSTSSLNESGWSICGGLLHSDDRRYGSSGKCLVTSNNNTKTDYVVTPILKGGSTITFYMRQYNKSYNAYVALYAVDAGGNITGEKIDEVNLIKSNSPGYVSKSLTVPSGDQRVALDFTYAAIDNLSYYAGNAVPSGIGVYSDSETTAAVKDGVDLSWGLVEEVQSQTYYIKNESDADWTNLSVEHTGNAILSSVDANLAKNGIVSLTITQASSGSTNDEITITAGSDLSFTINVSGTVKDNNHLWCDFSEGLPDGWNNTAGWTISTTGADGITSGKGYALNTAYGTNKRLYTPLVTIAEGENIYLMAKGYSSTASWNVLKIQYSADGSSWTDAKDLTGITNSWQSIEVSGIPAGKWYICFYGSYAYFTDIYGGTESTAPVLTLSQASYDFGLITESTTTPEAITITNSGKSALTGMSITSNNPNFMVAVTDNATEIAAKGGTATFNVTMTPNATGAQSATITIKSDNADDLTFTATGAVAKDGTTTVNFNDNALPSGWSKTGNTSFSDGAAYFYYSTNTLTSPKLIFVSGDFLVVKAKMASAYGYVTIKGSEDGVSFTQIKKLDSSVLNQTDYTTCVISDIASSVKYIQLDGYYCYVDEISGLTYAPVLSVTKGGSAATSGSTHAFGEIGSDQTVTYNFTNAGAGTINITGVESSNDVFTTNWTETVAASNYDLVITANYDANKAGDQNGTVTVTTTEGTFVINLTSTFLAADAPKFAALIGEAEQATGADLGFGIITSNTTKEFIIKNDGTGALNVTAVTMPDEDYTTDLESAPSAENPLVIAAGTSKTIQVTLAAAAKAIKSSKNITISATGFEDFTFTADAYILTGTETINFNSAIPSTWDNQDNGWSIYNNEAAKCTGKKNLTTSKLEFTGDNDFFIFKVKASDSGSGDYVTVEGSVDNGSTWTAFDKKTYSYSGDFGASTGDYSTIVVSGITSSVNKLRFNGYYVLIDEIEGLTYDDNDPRMGIYTDADCKDAATTAETKDFGFATTTQTATYYIKNDGTGTMTLALGDAPAGFTQNLDKTSVASGEKATLTITMPVADNAGYHNGNIVVTATDLGTFTVTATGVVVDEDKLNLNFASANIPSTWTKNNWSKNASGYIETSGYSSTSLETSQLTAVAGEDLVVIAQQTSSSSSYTFGINYKKVDAEEWSTLIAATNIGTSWTTLHATIPEAGDYLLQFTGAYSRIQRIYGLSEPNIPVMVVYDGEDDAAATYNFGSVANDADATHTFTVKNEGKAVLAGLTATLSGEQAAHYNVVVTGLTDGGVAAGSSATITVTQLKDNLGSHAATLTISSTSEGIANKVITLGGSTRDASKLYVDFAEVIPSNWTATSWSASSGYAQSAYSGTCTLQTPALTVAAGEELSFDLSKQYNNNYAELKVRYTTNGGVTWTEQDLANDMTYGSFTTKTLSLGNEASVTAVLQFVGTYYARIDNFYGGEVTTAPMIALAESSTAVASGSTKEFGNLTANGVATYTLSNNGSAPMVSTIATTGTATAVISGEGEGITIDGSNVTLAAGKSATITLTVPFAAPYGEKSGAMTIDSEGWVGDMVVNYTATTIDPSALYIDFADNTKPAGWYNTSWTFSNGYAQAPSSNTAAELITEQFKADTENTTLSFDAWYTTTSSWYTKSLTVYTSSDRKTWSEGKTIELTAESQTVSLDALAAGNYYVKFVGSYVAVDNIKGLKTVDAPAHDLYVTTSNIPTATKVPETEITATATVTSLRAAETGVYAKLFFDETPVATAEAADIALNGTANFTLTGNVPAAEKTYAAKIVVYYSDNSEAFETLTTNVEVAHTRTLAIQSFARVGEGTMEANSSNQISPTFKVTVQNTGTTALTPIIKVKQGETVVGTATGTELAANATSSEITVTATNMSAGEGGELSFTAEAYWSDAVDAEAFAYATPVTITVNAAAPKFDLALKGGAAVADGDAVAFGLVKAATTKTYTITNSGNKALELVSIVAPTGYSATAVTEDNKTIAASGTLDIDVTLNAEQGKVSGDLVFTYKVDASTNKTFTLNLSGRSVSEDTWTVAFNDYSASIPADWTNNGWSIAGEYNDYPGAAYTNTSAATLMTPRLQAAEGEELTFNVVNNYYNTTTFAYSSDKKTWSDEVAINGTGEKSFIAPAAGNYYIRFTGRGTYLQNFVGFQLNPLEHDTELAASSVPATGKQFNTYTATVTLKESAGKAEEVTADLYVDGKVKATKTETITANGSTVVTLTWEPQEVISDAVKAYVKVTATGIDLTTSETDLTIAEVYTLDEISSAATVDAVADETIVLKRSFVAGFNSVCLPFDVDNLETFFGEGAYAYEFTNFADNVLTFTKVSSLNASYPYIVYVPVATTEETATRKLEHITITSSNNTGFYKQSYGAYFRGTYAPIAAGEWTKNADTDNVYGLTSQAKIAKLGASASSKGFRAYFDIPAGALVKAISFDDGIETGVRIVNIDSEEAQQIFDLGGRKVNKTQKGIYIVNGKKVMKK